MKIKSIKKLKIPVNLDAILQEEEVWEDESYDPILITIEKVNYQGVDKISYSAEFEALDEYENIDGNEWEALIKIYISEKVPELLERVNGDSEAATCVIWTDNESNFRKTLGLMIELLERENEVTRLLNKKSK
ncbi:MAG: Imm51 family immunity protein [Bacteroidota bacterium]